MRCRTDEKGRIGIDGVDKDYKWKGKDIKRKEKWATGVNTHGTKDVKLKVIR